jgi:hypothetical protein
MYTNFREPQLAMCVCGKPFLRYRADHKWCSPPCYNRNSYYLRQGLASPYLTEFTTVLTQTRELELRKIRDQLRTELEDRVMADYIYPRKSGDVQ